MNNQLASHLLLMRHRIGLVLMRVMCIAAAIIVVYIGISDSLAQSPPLTPPPVWSGIREDGGLGLSSDSARAVAIDPSGNVVIVGATERVFALPEGRRTPNPFVAKYSAQGLLLWARLIVDQGQSSVFDSAYGVATDRTGNIYVTGDTVGTFPGEIPAGARDVFVAKYDPNGNVLWARQFGSMQADEARAIAVDSTGNAFIVGHSPGQLPLQPPTQSGDFFIAKFDTNGNRLWINQSGSPASRDEGLGVAVDAAGNAYMTGAVAGPFAGTTSPGSGLDAYVAKFDANGNRLWFSRVGSASTDVAQGVAVSADGGTIYLAGYTNGDFDLPGFPAQPIPCCTNPDAFIARLDGNGVLQWAHNLSSTILAGPRYFDDQALGIATDPLGSVAFIAGYTSGVMPGEASKGAEDIFVARYESGGARTWVRQPGSTIPASAEMNDRGFGIALDASGELFVVGEAIGTIGTPNPNIDRTDWFVLKMRAADGVIY